MYHQIPHFEQTQNPHFGYRHLLKIEFQYKYLFCTNLETSSNLHITPITWFTGCSIVNTLEIAY